MAVRLTALIATALYSQEDYWNFLPLGSLVGPRTVVGMEGLDELKKSNKLVENKTRDLPACSTIVPQPTMLPPRDRK
jgi:hypothetical protein